MEEDGWNCWVANRQHCVAAINVRHLLYPCIALLLVLLVRQFASVVVVSVLFTLVIAMDTMTGHNVCYRRQ
jgi:hypothetical protein